MQPLILPPVLRHRLPTISESRQDVFTCWLGSACYKTLEQLQGSGFLPGCYCATVQNTWAGQTRSFTTEDIHFGWFLNVPPQEQELGQSMRTVGSTIAFLYSLKAHYSLLNTFCGMDWTDFTCLCAPSESVPCIQDRKEEESKQVLYIVSQKSLPLFTFEKEEEETIPCFSACHTRQACMGLFSEYHPTTILPAAGGGRGPPCRQLLFC